MFSDFKYSFLFLGKFLAVYFCGNLLYGLYIDSFQQTPDPITYWVTNQTCQVQKAFGVPSSIRVNEGKPSISMRNDGDGVINVFEGCNGVNVMIVFVAFIVAFGGRSWKRMTWFLLLGLAIIHIFNLLRIILLYAVAQQNTHYFYYIHKYFFTAALYFVVIVLWIVWVTRLSAKQTKQVE